MPQKVKVRPFILCYEATREDGIVWALRWGVKWFYAREVDIRVPVHTVFRGPKARQPRAYLRGHGRLTTQTTDILVIEA